MLASSAYTKPLADETKELSALTGLIQTSLLSELLEAASHAIRRLQEEAALSNDVAQLMGAIPSLANAMRYGNVRNTEVDVLAAIVRGLVARICVKLPVAEAFQAIAVKADVANQTDVERLFEETMNKFGSVM